MTDAAIEASKLTKDVFSSFLRTRMRVLTGVDLKIARGETYGLLGPNGAGKTTTLKLLVGLIKPTSGYARVLGSQAGDRQALQRIGYLPENPYFYSHLTGREFLEFIGCLFGMPAKLRRHRAEELMEMVRMRPAAELEMRKYSKGMLQRLGIAQSLINDPEVIFLDEPMSGLDPIGRLDVRNILKSLKESGKTIFFNSHLLPDVAEVCDRVGVLHRGTLVAEEQVRTISASGSYRDLEEYFLGMVAKEVREKTDDAPANRTGGTTDRSDAHK
jgi:ABC-2 type transport system ATP-binding protein